VHLHVACRKEKIIPYKLIASFGMIQAREAGLSVRWICELWGGLGAAQVLGALQRAGVTTTNHGYLRPPEDTIARYRIVAATELANGIPAGLLAKATPGMIVAYQLQLSVRMIGELWGLSPNAVWRRLRHSDVKMREPKEARRAAKPPEAVMNVLRGVAQRERAENPDWLTSRPENNTARLGK
jgi:hypothetical protein